LKPTAKQSPTVILSKGVGQFIQTQKKKIIHFIKKKNQYHYLINKKRIMFIKEKYMLFFKDYKAYQLVISIPYLSKIE